MASDTNVSAALLDAGMGPPPVWKCLDDTGTAWAFNLMSFGGRDVSASMVDLSDPQTAFGVALNLDEWERAGGKSSADELYDSWAVELAVFAGNADIVTEILQRMAERLTQIGEDHAIRRALGWGEPKPGTLATLRKAGAGGWWLEHGDRREYFTGGMSSAGHDGIAGLRAEGGGYITDEAEARRAIYEALCAGGDDE